jgi:hypothetical protein
VSTNLCGRTLSPCVTPAFCVVVLGLFRASNSRRNTTTRPYSPFIFILVLGPSFFLCVSEPILLSLFLHPSTSLCSDLPVCTYLTPMLDVPTVVTPCSRVNSSELVVVMQIFPSRPTQNSLRDLLSVLSFPLWFDHLMLVWFRAALLPPLVGLDCEVVQVPSLVSHLPSSGRSPRASPLLPRFLVLPSLCLLPDLVVKSCNSIMVTIQVCRGDHNYVSPYGCKY